MQYIRWGAGLEVIVGGRIENYVPTINNKNLQMFE